MTAIYLFYLILGVALLAGLVTLLWLRDKGDNSKHEGKDSGDV